jgi:pimeloyl-ACP methyl ester carboxylesterase
MMKNLLLTHIRLHPLLLSTLLSLAWMLGVVTLPAQAEAEIRPNNSSCDAIYFPTDGMLYIPCIEVFGSPVNMPIFEVLLRQIALTDPIELALTDAIPLSVVQTENRKNSKSCYAVYYQQNGLVEIPCLTVSSASASEMYTVSLTQTASSSESMQLAVVDVSEKIRSSTDSVATNKPPILLTPFNGNTQINASQPIYLTWELNNPLDGISTVSLSLRELNGANMTLGDYACQLKNIGLVQLYSVSSCSVLKTNQWYRWTVTLFFYDGSSSAASGYFKTQTSQPATGGALEMRFTGSGVGQISSDQTAIQCAESEHPNGCDSTFSSDTITLTATPENDSVFNGWSGACSGRSPTCVVTQNPFLPVEVTAHFKKEARVVLLLHGMNSSETTWNDFVADESKITDCPTIALGVIEGGVLPPATLPSLGCYRLRFGQFDTLGGRVGLEGVRATGPTRGDFSTFEQLGQEVKYSIAAILNAYRTAYQDAYAVRIALVGHSRGGLAARAFLQKPENSEEKQSVVALLTTGTPHLGSPLGRVYRYLQQNCVTSNGSRKESTFLGFSLDSCADDWDVVDLLRGKYMINFNPICSLLQDETLDVRRPTIDDLSDQSVAIQQLSDGIPDLPNDGRIVYASLRYTGIDLGHLARYYRIFDIEGPDACEQVSYQAQSAILQGQSSSSQDMIGDGIVPKINQKFPFNWVTEQPLQQNPKTGEIFHTKEPRQQIHLSTALDEMLPSWRIRTE